MLIINNFMTNQLKLAMLSPILFENGLGETEEKNLMILCSTLLSHQKYILNKKSPNSWLSIKKLRGVYYISPLPECKEAIENYILYDRKNHPAKNGVGRLYISLTELDRINATLYPDGLDIMPMP
jgi:hypothetical protein